MVYLAELSLPEIDLFSPAFAADPHGTFRQARETGAWLAKYQFGYIPLDFESVSFFFRADDKCRMPNRDITEQWNAQNTSFARFINNVLHAMSGKEHTRLRRMVNPAFVPREANKHRAFMRERIREIVAEWLPSGQCDFTQVIKDYPIGVICELIGIARKDIPIFEKWLDKLESAYAQDNRALPELNHTIEGIFGYLENVLATRRSMDEKPNDLLQALLNITEEGGLTDEEILCMLTFLMGAGFDTTKNQIAFIIYLMTQHPHYWKRAAEEPEYCNKIIEESLRYMSPVGAMHRITNEEIEYRGITLPPNTWLSLSQNVPGRDPAVNPDPDRFDPDREKAVHIAFGQGEHFCLGHNMARALLEEAIPVLAKAMLDPKLNGEPTFRSPMGAWGLDTLPIKFTPGTV
jgi:cytochrome P450